MDEINEGLEYAQMLEIPVSTVNVVKKKSFFSRKAKPAEDLKSKVVETVNDRVGETTAVQTESVGAPADAPSPAAKKKSKLKDGTAGKIIMAEAVIACLIAAGIFITNIFVQNTAINTFMGGLTAVKEKEAAYNEIPLTSVVGDFADTEITESADGVIRFTDKTTVYPVCDGEVASVTESNGLYTVKINHTSEFSSVITGLNTVYSAVGDKVKANLPFAYSDGENEVSVSMYDGETLLNNYTLSGAVPVWNS